MPNEDFVYLGDHARLPYGTRPLVEVAGFAAEIGRYLEAHGVKPILVACNTATAAALPEPPAPRGPPPGCPGCGGASTCRSSASSRPRPTRRCRPRATAGSASSPRRQ